MGGYKYTNADKEVDDRDVARTQNNAIGKIKVGTVEAIKSIEPSVSPEEAKKIYDKMKYNFDPREFLLGMQAELEHSDVTGGDLVLTAKIAAAHLREVPNYYTLLKKYVETGK